MAQVNTALGPVDATTLGQTLMHEHICVVNPEIEKWPPGKGLDPSEEWDEERVVREATEKLRDLKNHGIDSLLDLTVIGLGRNTEMLLRVAQAVPEINVLLATGLYTYSHLPFFFYLRGPGTMTGGPELMTQMWIRDIEQGMANTGVKPAILKCATDHEGLTAGVERVLRSVAQAHRQTGVPINTHTPMPPEPWGLEQQRIFREEGVNLTRVVIGHAGGTSNLDYQRALMDHGSFIGMDRFGVGPLSLEETSANVARLCELGYAGQMLLSHDSVCYADWLANPELMRGRGWTHITKDVLPALSKAGVSDEHIRQMMVVNPATVLAPAAPY